MTADTIAAIATPPGIGGVGVVRVSGPAAQFIARTILGRDLSPRSATFATFSDDQGFPIDEGIALLFQGPRSFTGEDILELQGHGGPLILDLVLKRCLELGARLAQPGEFTQRAFLNGKMDLTQAEAVADLIESSTTLGARLAIRSLQGAFSQRVHALVEDLVQLRIVLEATLDFPEEDLDLQPSLINDLSKLIAQTQSLLSEAQQGERIRDGLTVVIAGPPNAGKSSLLNLLSQSDAAIVTPVAGTTRDVLKTNIQVDGLPVTLVDTAGLRASTDIVEQEGIRRAHDQISQADLILWVYDAAMGLVASDLDSLPDSVPLTLIRNKIDLVPNQPSSADRSRTEIAICALSGQGVDQLRNHLQVRAGVEGMGEGAFVARRRHLDALERALNGLHSAHHALVSVSAIELAALDLRAAQESLGEITGEFTSDDLLGRIFSSFCIGK